jgi:leucyl aminopeptidase
LEFRLTNNNISDISCDAVITYVFSDQLRVFGSMVQLDQILEGSISQLFDAGEITGKLGETTVIHTFGKIKASRVIVVGLGKRNDFKHETIRQGAGYGVKVAQKLKTKDIATIIPYSEDMENSSLITAVHAIVEGMLLGSYKYEQFKSENVDMNKKIDTVLIIESDLNRSEDINEGIRLGCVYGQAVNMVRDLVNSPANHFTPEDFAKKSKSIADEYGLEVTILSEQEIKASGMELMYSVGQGSDHPSKLIILRYDCLNENADTIALVGKGLTFDSGGISLKPSEGMQEMKNDMAGGAAVLGAMQIIAQLKPNCSVLGIIPAVENMPSGKATKPGDVFKGLAGKTVEVINTDAEGRLVLADAVAYAHKLGAEKVIDIATLTGACLIALGKNYSAVIGNNQELIEQVIKAGKESGEQFWQLPGDEEFKQLLKSDVADLKNTGGRYGGTITGGLFIGEFLPPEIPWVHLDIAGTAWTEKDKSYFTKGATGFGTRTLVNLVRIFG